MNDVNDLMQTILEMDAAQRKATEKAKLERTARLAALDEQKQKIIAECDAREKAACEAAAKAAEQGNAAALAALEQQCQQAAEAMTAAAEQVKTGQITFAVRDTVFEDKEIKEGNEALLSMMRELTFDSDETRDAVADLISVLEGM